MISTKSTIPMPFDAVRAEVTPEGLPRLVLMGKGKDLAVFDHMTSPRWTGTLHVEGTLPVHIES